MSILLSTNPPHAGNICFGKKTVELRKFPLPKGTAFIYETKRGGGCGLVIGEVEVAGYIVADPKRMLDDFLKGALVSRDFVLQYAGDSAVYVNFLINPVLYDKPIPLIEFKRPCDRGGDCDDCERWGGYEHGCTNITRPPQSWMYVEKG